MEYTRFDVPETVQNIIEKAIEIDIINGTDIIVLMVNYHMRWERIVDEIINYAYADHHVNDNHKIIAPYADEFWKS